MPPTRWTIDEKTTGAVWYSGAGERYTSSARLVIGLAYCTSGCSSRTVRSGSGNRIPFGRPVVPDE